MAMVVVDDSVLGLLLLLLDWSFARLLAPGVAATSVILSSSKIQNGNIVLENDH